MKYMLHGFDARLCLIDSAQTFFWTERNGAYACVSLGRRALVEDAPEGARLTCEAADLPYWRRYFDEERDYARLAEVVAPYPAAARAVSLLPGLRVLNQPPWEALLQFILSANNNAVRIRGLALALAREIGDGEALPSPDALAEAGEARLRALGCGYRAPYLVKTARAVADGFPLDSLKDLPYGEARALLTTLPGVGNKVADCTLLFGCAHAEAFPVDVWVERLMRAWFLPDARDKRAISEAAARMFGRDAGLVQQYLFHCARTGLMDATASIACSASLP